MPLLYRKVVHGTNAFIRRLLIRRLKLIAIDLANLGVTSFDKSALRKCLIASLHVLNDWVGIELLIFLGLSGLAFLAEPAFQALAEWTREEGISFSHRPFQTPTDESVEKQVARVEG